MGSRFSFLRSDQSKGVFASCVIHGLLFAGAGGVLVQPPRYEVQAGTGGMEVSLIAAPLPAAGSASDAPAIPDVKTEDAPAPSPDDWVLQDAPLPPPQEGGTTSETPQEALEGALRQASPYVGDGSSPVAGKDPTTLLLSGGAVGGKGGRFGNPAPAYPYAAIRDQQEGLVLLTVVIDQAGRPISVDVSQSSGFPLLDDSALRTVRRWKFDPAHIGFLPVQSKIIVPIRFVLDDRFTLPR